MIPDKRLSSPLNSTVFEKQRAPMPSALLPLLTFGGWWILCYIIYFIGWPITYSRTNAALVGLMFSSCLIMVFVGYNAGIRQPLAERSQPCSSRVPWMGLVVAILLFIPVNSAYAGFSVAELSYAFQNQAAAYSQASDRISEGYDARSLIVLAQTLFAPLTLAALPYFSLQWFERRQSLIPLIISITLPVLTSVLVGRDQQIGIVALILTLTWMMSRVRRNVRFHVSKLMMFGVASVVLLLAFGARKLARSQGYLPCAPGSNRCEVLGQDASVWDAAVTFAASYASQGFEGLGRAFNATWNSGGGFSHSRALVNILSGGEQRDGLNQVVTEQLDYLGWSSSAYWSTGFASLANDLPWVFVPFVVSAQALLLGLVWRSACRNADWLSVTLVCYTWISLFFMPQNLQLAASGPTYVGYLLLVILYLLRRLRGRRARSETTDTGRCRTVEDT